MLIAETDTPSPRAKRASNLSSIILGAIVFLLVALIGSVVMNWSLIDAQFHYAKPERQLFKPHN
jgi:hypothetical protein